MATAPSYMSGDYDIEQQKAQRQRLMADQLRQQSQTPLQGHMAGQYYAAPSWTQGLAKVLQGYQANKLEKGADTMQSDAAKAKQTAISEALKTFGEKIQGTPGQAAFDVPANEMDPQTTMNAVPAQPGNPMQAYQGLMNSGVSELQNMGMQGVTSQAAEQAKLQQAEAKNQKIVQALQATKGNPQAAIAAGVPPEMVKSYYESPNFGKEKGVVNNGVLQNPLTGETMAPAIAKQADAPNQAKDLLIPDGKGGFMPNAPLVAVKHSLAKAGASNVNNTVSVAGPENQYNKDIGAGLAKDSLDLINAAKAAPEVVNNARMVRKALDAGAITGTGADIRLGVQKALETAGLVGPGKAASTQELMAGLGKITLSGIKTSGLGGGNGFTDKDRAFLESAISGQIDSTPANLRRVADLSERVATASHTKGSAVIKRMQQDPALKNVIQDTALDPIAPENDLKSLLNKY